MSTDGFNKKIIIKPILIKPIKLVQTSAKPAISVIDDEFTNLADDISPTEILLDLRLEKARINCTKYNELILNKLDLLISKTKELKASAVGKDKTAYQYKINSYLKAISTIKGLDHDLTEVEIRSTKLPGIGQGIQTRILEILSTGDLKELQAVGNIRDQAIVALQSVHGIGEARATLLVDKYGITSVDQLRSAYKSGDIGLNTNELTEAIVIGLIYHDDMKLRIPWAEVDQIKNRINTAIQNLDSNYRTYVCGSYRRRKPTCGDIDMLITHEEIKTEVNLENSTINHLHEIINHLNELGILIANLTHHGRTKYMGICKLSADLPGRRIDIRFIAKQSLGAGLLYFTGSGMFNKIMRFKANERGYTLNEYNLSKLSDNSICPAETEEEIFKVLKFKYLTPEERDF